MHKLRLVAHLSFDAAAAFFYAGSIAIILAAITFVITQLPAFGLAIAAVSFVLVFATWSRMLWRRRRGSPHVFACPHRMIPSSCSDRSRAVIPIDPDHPFQGIPISLWSAGRNVTAPVG
jgi:hypothetical protein